MNVCLLIKHKRHEKQLANDAAGHRQLLRWAHALAKSTPCHFCLEASGPYAQGVALFLVENEQRVSVINPTRLRFFGLAQNQGNKTDKADARLIAQYCQMQSPHCQMQSPPPWRIAAAPVRVLHACCTRVAGDGASPSGAERSGSAGEEPCSGTRPE